MSRSIVTNTPCAGRRPRLVVAALAIAVVLGLASFAAPGLGAAHAQAGDYSMTAIVDEVAGDDITVRVQVDPRAVPLGALEGSLVFNPDAVKPTGCDFVGDLGACNPLEDRLRFSALFLEGLGEPTTIMTVTFESTSSDTETTIEFEDIAGFDASTAPLSVSTTGVTFTTGSGSQNPLLIVLPVIAVAAIAGLGFLSMRNRKERENRDL